MQLFASCMGNGYLHLHVQHATVCKFTCCNMYLRGWVYTFTRTRDPVAPSNQKVLGSNPSWILSFFRIFHNDLALMFG